MNDIWVIDCPWDLQLLQDRCCEGRCRWGWLCTAAGVMVLHPEMKAGATFMFMCLQDLGHLFERIHLPASPEARHSSPQDQPCYPCSSPFVRMRGPAPLWLIVTQSTELITPHIFRWRHGDAALEHGRGIRLHGLAMHNYR